MELTPQAVSEAEFREAKRGGYNIRDVDEFLDRVSIGVGQMQEHIREAYQRAETAENRVVDLQRQLEEAQRRASDSPGGDTEDTLRRTLVLAQRTADATIKEAKEEAERLLTEARDEASSTRAAAETEIREGMVSARQEAEAEVQQLIATRQELAEEITGLERHLEMQREQVRTSVQELQRLLDDPSTLRAEPAPPLAPIPDLPSNGSVPPVTAFPPDAEPAWGDADSEDAAVLEGSVPPSDDAGPSPDRPPLPSRSPGKRREEQREPAPQGEGAGSEPSGFRPDLPASFDPSEDRGPRQGVPGDDEELSLPIDAPPPPPPPPGLDHVSNVGGIPIEPGSRPSEWGKGVFDTDEDDEPKGTRFGRRR